MARYFKEATCGLDDMQRSSSNRSTQSKEGLK
ncbi:hypothetical protein [Neisseria sp. P0018.S006]